MSGFDSAWLDLREPLDSAARNGELLRQAARLGSAGSIVDIGCGTGSTYRVLAPHLAEPARWCLIDMDVALLDEARQRHGDGLAYRVADIADVGSLPLEGATLVTASALFDLCSEAFMVTLVQAISTAGAGLYAALNYDGAVEFHPQHPLDHAVIEAFNRHQRTDKGFGPAAGPDAVSILEQALADRGYRSECAKSDWHMVSPSQQAVQRAFIDGLVRAAGEMEMIEPRDIAGWHAHRMAEAARSSCRVGHTDLLAIPG
ncbi:class I SAM-dependent methyltransferase [Phyllobacterium sp. 21LDTY02-6]|uniref:class I SAM-dependent methyltransferase n=1 Tax=Phyllobacterium sp. 21LDTY02-6 TaxID=2944903 RepID=UPI0020201307|nr:class I SAM-dependent methyltransferase [Phyllobacterium sp. 21LDTY02-6]MCO4318234.1 class I SAM-dependent methyltransferase [Phyllobacterium sp. 21LDTY02-6]